MAAAQCSTALGNVTRWAFPGHAVHYYLGELVDKFAEFGGIFPKNMQSSLKEGLASSVAVTWAVCAGLDGVLRNHLRRLPNVARVTEYESMEYCLFRVTPSA